MISKSVSMQSSINKSYASYQKNQVLTKKMSMYQIQMKQHYEELEKRAQENYKKDREIVDHLNDWKYCDPDNNQDELPMPYRYIDEFIKDDIIKQVLVKVGEIEKQKLDPSYDGQLKAITPSGDIESLKSATFISEPKGNPSKHIIIGDKFGNIFIFDQTKKQIVSKFDQLPKKRVIHISSVHTKLIESHVVTIAVVQRAANKVSILRYIDGENTLQLQSVVTVSQQSQTSGQNASSYVYESVISLNSTYLALLHYNGNVSIYKITEPPLEKREAIIDEDQSYFQRADDTIQSQTSLSRNQSPRYERNSTPYKLPVFNAKELPDLKQHYLIEFKGKKREKKYDEIMKEIQKDNDVLRSSLLGISVEEMYAQIASKQANSQQQQQQQSQPPAAAAPNNQKKDAKKPLSKEEIKKEEAAKIAQQQQQQLQKPPDFLKNKEVIFGQDNFDQQYGDISDDVNKPFYQPKIVFLKEKVTFSNKDKQFNKPFTQEIVTGLIVTWYNSKNFQYHVLNETTFQNLPVQQQYKYTQSEIRQPSQPSSFKPHMTNNYTLIYAITCMDLCESQKYTGFGMKDGNIIIWDNEFQVESKSLQNHSSSITCLAFFHEKYLVSGCNNGYVLIQSLEKENQYQILSNTYKVQKQNPILSIQVNKYGLVLAIDSKKNVRMYNIHLKKKIAALHPKISYDKLDSIDEQNQNQLTWSISPYLIFHLSKDGDQIYILNEEVNLLKLENLAEKEKEQVQKSQKKDGNIQIFKLADSLSNVYEGVRNLYRNGVDKDKILFQFTQMTQADLENKEYSIAGQQSVLQNQTVGSLNKKSILLPRFSIHKKATTTLNQSSVSQTNLKILQQNISSNFSRDLSSLKTPFLPNLNKLKDQLSSPKSDYSSINSARKSINFKITSQPQGLTEQKLHPEKYLWKSQYTESSSYDPINNTLIQARERVSRQHLLEESLNKSIIVLEKNLKAKEDEKQARIELEKKRLLQQSIDEIKQKKKQQTTKKN
ncbi:WD domain, G-beta repeat protein (macronuclear) [Tetrahymena thermophila SB210]|uniref:WD domain, G-beta repeat protein n=1 Tax=Tetrahymena thermophila (strain SB210) TaxID=312017 RepID=I7MCI4_TETTS|nr:WD domain, G-beta repeat protein [Tetrahymena thermophila SB210]EAR84004.2 WD domain, G-beta repeat protein [Tetrahymena thermophila SB210]|eukprot:XP_001031667.2 WD domain, G-beta repeat protein [Tetrahymena thermophila SB210]